MRLTFQSILLIFILPFYIFTANGQTSQTLHARGLYSSVEIVRDKWGMNHIYAGNEHDLFFTQGYCAAKDRLFQLEIWRRQATGTLAEILGASEIKRDIGARLFAYRGNMSTEFSHYHDRGKEIILAFTDGVNAYIDQANAHPSELPVEFRILQIKPGRWTPQVVISRHQGILGNVLLELNIGRAVAQAGEKKVKEIMWFHPKDPLITLDSSIDQSLLSDNILELYAAYHRDVQFEKTDSAFTAHTIQPDYPETVAGMGEYFGHRPEGSNNWIVSGKRTNTGFPMLANDPHRKISVPSLRYLVHLVAPGWNVIGAGEPEIPGVSVGHNEFGAWGITVSETDGEDLYIYDLNPLNLNQYRYKNQWTDMEQTQEIISVKGATALKIILHYTKHGPVTFIDSVHHKAYAVRSASLDPGGAPYLSSLRIDQARSWNTFRTACRFMNIPALNMVWADKKGNIGWQTVGSSPIRKNYSGLVPEPGDGRYEWSGILPIPEKPHLLNPSKGFFATANQSLSPAGYTHWDANGFTWPDDFRADRINNVLASQEKMDMKKMAALQTDYLSVPATLLVPMLSNITFHEGPTREAKNLFKNWDYQLTKESPAAAVYVMWERILMQEAGKQFIPENIRGLVYIQTTKLITWLKQPEIIFPTPAAESRNEFLRKTFEQAVDSIRIRLGDSVSNWQYGQTKFKHIQFIHPLSIRCDTVMQQKLNTASLPRSGYGHTVCSTGDMDNQNTGASYRQIADTHNWDNTLMCNSPGQSGNPGSPFYKNLFAIWAADQYFPAYFSRKKINEVAAEKIKLLP